MFLFNHLCLKYFFFLLRVQSEEVATGKEEVSLKHYDSLIVWVCFLLTSLRIYPQSYSNIKQQRTYSVRSSFCHWTDSMIILFCSPQHMTHLPVSFLETCVLEENSQMLVPVGVIDQLPASSIYLR